MALLRNKWLTPALLVLLAAVGVLTLDAGAAGRVGRWLDELTAPRQAAKPATPAVKPAPRPLGEVIPACRAKGPGFHACMFDAGYAVNPAWSDAHKAGTPTRDNAAGQADALRDPFREGTSPAYGVPYWVTREAVAAKP